MLSHTLKNIRRGVIRTSHHIHKRWKEFMALPDGERRSIIIITGIILIVLLALLNTIPFNPEDVCIENSGVWISEHNECENIEKSVCDKMHGEYKECASPCRHNSSASVCLKRCVKVCRIE